jgi:hypothetical protein
VTTLTISEQRRNGRPISPDEDPSMRAIAGIVGALAALVLVLPH